MIFRIYFLKGVDDGFQLLPIIDAYSTKRLGPCLVDFDVGLEQPSIKLDGMAELLHERIGRLCKPAAPGFFPSFAHG